MQNIFEEDLDKAISKLDKAVTSGGMFISLKDDGDNYHCVMMEIPQLYMHTATWEGEEKTTKRAKGNWAVFEQVDETDEYKFDRLAIWDNVDPKKYKLLLTDIKEFGQKKLYKLVRVGKKKDPKTEYRIYPQRDLTAEEMTMLHKLELLNLNRPEDKEAEIDGAKEEVAKQIDRLGWTMEQYEVANVKHFGEKRETKDMAVTDRDLFITALAAMEPGAEPSAIGAVATLELEEDPDFF